jgi:hypothetical protein
MGTGPSEEKKDEGFSDPEKAKTPETEEDEGKLSDLENPEIQEKYRKAMIEQIKRQSCPGCGDDGPLPF